MKFKQQIAPHLLDEENSVKYTEPITLNSLNHKFIVSKAEVILDQVDYERPVAIQAPKVILKKCNLERIAIYTSELYVETSILETVELRNVEKLVVENSKLIGTDLQLFEERKIPELILKKSTLYFENRTEIDNLISSSVIDTLGFKCKSWTHNSEHIFTDDDYLPIRRQSLEETKFIQSIGENLQTIHVGNETDVIYVNLLGEKIVIDSIEFLVGHAPNALQVIEYFKKKNIYFKRYFLVDMFNHRFTTKIEFNPFA